MYNFALIEIKEIIGLIRIFKLLINSNCEFDDFEKEIQNEGTYTKELITIQARLQQVAEGKSLPLEKFRDITPKGESIKEYEVKTKHLRVYLFHEERTGRIIVCGGKKTTQKKDMAHFRNIKKNYFSNK